MATSVLIVLDGWGHSETPDHNAIHQARTPHWDELWATAPRTLISASGIDVGLPADQMGNSEVGHMTIGAGRTIFQDLTRIDQAIEDNSFNQNPVFEDIFAMASGHRLHVMGLLSPGGVHSHENHIAEIIQMARQRRVEVILHAFLDGRDTPPQSAESSLQRFDKMLAEEGTGTIGSVCGRYFAMDRDQRWDRTEAAYRMLAEGVSPYHAEDPLKALNAAYARGETDEFVQPTLIGNRTTIKAGDVILFMNFRADRARQLSRAFVEARFRQFPRNSHPKLRRFVTMTQYAADLGSEVDDQSVRHAFEPQSVVNSIGEHLSKLGKTQLRIAETEKYAHVTFFFSGGQEQPYPGEDRILIPSPNVATYDLAPEMGAHEITDNLVRVLKEDSFDFIVCNFANGDMVGHTGDFAAAKQAVETIDDCIGRIKKAVEQSGSHCLITADHGNVERMLDLRTHQLHTAHTSERVPLVYIGRNVKQLANNGTLADVAPTLLALMRIEIPGEMTGRSLLMELNSPSGGDH